MIYRTILTARTTYAVSHRELQLWKAEPLLARGMWGCDPLTQGRGFWWQQEVEGCSRVSSESVGLWVVVELLREPGTVRRGC